MRRFQKKKQNSTPWFQWKQKNFRILILNIILIFHIMFISLNQSFCFWYEILKSKTMKIERQLRCMKSKMRHMNEWRAIYNYLGPISMQLVLVIWIERRWRLFLHTLEPSQNTTLFFFDTIYDPSLLY